MGIIFKDVNRSFILNGIFFFWEKNFVIYYIKGGYGKSNLCYINIIFVDFKFIFLMKCVKSFFFYF